MAVRTKSEVTVIRLGEKKKIIEREREKTFSYASVFSLIVIHNNCTNFKSKFIPRYRVYEVQTSGVFTGRGTGVLDPSDPQ